MQKIIFSQTEDLLSSSDAAREVKPQSRDALETCICLSLEESVLATFVVKALLFWCEMVDGRDRFCRWVKVLKEQHPELCNPLLLFECKEEDEEVKEILFCRKHFLSPFSTAVSNLDCYGYQADAIYSCQRESIPQSEAMHKATRLDFYCTLQI